MSNKPKFCYSYDGDYFFGRYDSPEEALASAGDSDVVIVGECVDAPTVECLDADDVLEQIRCNDAYSCEGADEWPAATREQLAELTAGLRALVGEWIERNGLQPQFYTVRNAVTYRKHEHRRSQVELVGVCEIGGEGGDA